MCHKMDADRWEEMLAKVPSAIHLNLSDGIIHVIIGEEKTKAIWQKLEYAYGKIFELWLTWDGLVYEGLDLKKLGH